MNAFAIKTMQNSRKSNHKFGKELQQLYSLTDGFYEPCAMRCETTLFCSYLFFYLCLVYKVLLFFDQFSILYYFNVIISLMNLNYKSNLGLTSLVATCSSDILCATFTPSTLVFPIYIIFSRPPVCYLLS